MILNIYLKEMTDFKYEVDIQWKAYTFTDDGTYYYHP
jgi:hypothetical protein